MTLILVLSQNVYSQKITVAAASSLRPTLDYLVEAYESENPGNNIEIIYGSSGRLMAQIINGAPFDIFMSADMEFPQNLFDQGMATSVPVVYGLGRIVLWSAHLNAADLKLEDLADQSIRRIAIAQPAVAPYGQRAREAMEAAGVWDKVQSRLVFAENISQVAQMSESGAADIGIVALSLAIQPGLAERGYYLIDTSRHQPLEQGFVITRRAAQNRVAADFSVFLVSETAKTIFQTNGFDTLETEISEP
ncbi:MAG: molybdate ABC transporter substrate-binding protein [Pseudohongiella sp.]|nr:molybdate ABC transporter substrate-binding protein [Pseudohongiella sp.]